MKLYALNTPCWSDYDPKNTKDTSLINSKLSDHFTFMYYNFMKYGLVDEVEIFLDEKRIKRGVIEKEFFTKYGKMTIRDRNKVNFSSLEKNQIVYCWSNWSDCRHFKDNFVIVNPMFSNVLYPSELEKGVHDYALIEGIRCEPTVPEWMPYDVFRYTSSDFCEITNNQREEKERKYDWIMVSSFDPRKRHIEMLTSLSKNEKTKRLKGCIVARDPRNKVVAMNLPQEILYNSHKIIKKSGMDVDIFLNASQEKKKNLLLDSKTFLCGSILDNGPRAMIEAAQSGAVLLSMPHIGSSDLISEGSDLKRPVGEFYNDFEDFPKKLIEILESIKNYDINLCSQILNPDTVYPKLIEKIRSIKNDKLK